jgi:hypothetical protein
MAAMIVLVAPAGRTGVARTKVGIGAMPGSQRAVVGSTSQSPVLLQACCEIRTLDSSALDDKLERPAPHRVVSEANYPRVKR